MRSEPFNTGGLLIIWFISHALANATVILAGMQAERPLADGYTMLLYLNTIPLALTYSVIKVLLNHPTGLPDDVRARLYGLACTLPGLTGLLPSGVWARLITSGSGA